MNLRELFLFGDWGRPTRDRNTRREKRGKAVRAAEGRSFTKAGGFTVSNALPRPKWTEIKKRTENMNLGH